MGPHRPGGVVARCRNDSGSSATAVTRDGDRLKVDGLSETFDGVAVVAGDHVWVTVRGEVFNFTVGRPQSKSESRDHDAFTPPMSATVVRILVNPGDTVSAGDVLIALEAMKMELPIRAPRDGVIKAIHCRAGELVQPGTSLLDME